MNLHKNKLFIFLLTYLVSSNAFAYKIRPYVELSSAYYFPFSDIKNDFNLGLYSVSKVDNYLSLGLGISSNFSFNIKETIVFKRKFLRYFEPLTSLQFKYNNFRPYNAILEGPVSYALFFKNSLIGMIGLQLGIKKSKFKLQLQSGISYNFEKIDEPLNKSYPKAYKDINFNSINQFSFIKIF